MLPLFKKKSIKIPYCTWIFTHNNVFINELCNLKTATVRNQWCDWLMCHLLLATWRVYIFKFKVQKTFHDQETLSAALTGLNHDQKTTRDMWQDSTLSLKLRLALTHTHVSDARLYDVPLKCAKSLVRPCSPFHGNNVLWCLWPRAAKSTLPTTKLIQEWLEKHNELISPNF